MLRIHLSELVSSIRFKLLASLLLLLGLSISASLFGLWTYERDRYTDIAKAEAARAATIVEQSLRQAMLENDWEMIRRSMHDIKQIIEPSAVTVTAMDGRVVASGGDYHAGRHFRRDQDLECRVCHGANDGQPRQTSIFLETDDGPVLRNVRKIDNTPDCHACHDPGLDNLGVFLYDVPFGGVIDMLRTVLVRIVLTGLVTFILVVVVLSLIVRRYVHRPLQQLGEGFIQVGRGNFDYWVEVEVEGEIQAMADQFNVMNQALKRSFSEIKEKSWETEQLYVFVKRLSQVTEWRQLRRLITDLLASAFTADKAALLLSRQSTGGRMVVEVSWRLRGDRRYYHREVGDDETEVDLKLPAWLPAVDEVRRQDLKITERELTFSNGDTVARIPLISGQIYLGLFWLVRDPSQPFSNLDKKLLAALVEQIVIALANARLYRLAITDSLTGLYSKRYCDTVIRNFLDAHTANPVRVFSVLMLDLDFFKRVNDTHGHQVGDEVLVQLAGLIRKQLRHDDVACRYGGEEFIVLVAGDLEVARTVAARLVGTVADHTFRCAGGLTLHNTISIGGATFPEHGQTPNEVVKAADQALYEAKRSGRNRHKMYDELKG